MYLPVAWVTITRLYSDTCGEKSVCYPGEQKIITQTPRFPSVKFYIYMLCFVNCIFFAICNDTVCLLSTCGFEVLFGVVLFFQIHKMFCA